MGLEDQAMELCRSIVAVGAKPNTIALGALSLGAQTLRCWGRARGPSSAL